MAMGHVILKEFHIDRQAEYFDDYARQYTDMPMLVRLVKQRRAVSCRSASCAPRISTTSWARPTIRNGRRSPTTRPAARSSCRKGSVGFRWGEKGKWNLEEKASDGARHQAAPVADR